MSDKPKRWLIEVGLQYYFMDGYADAEAAAAAWAKKYGKEDLLKVSEVLPGYEICTHLSVRTEYR